MSTKLSRLVSFDGTEGVEAQLARPERYSDLLSNLTGAVPFIPRGAGLSYSAASMASRALSVDMRRFDRILGFDEATGDVTLEPGVSVGSLIDFLAERGFYLPVVPGYPEITIGGCVAFDVHGKSQVHSGNFGEWVREIQLFHPIHGSVRCTPEHHSEAFELTLGGFGLTGMITQVRLRSMRLPGPALELETVPVDNLVHAVEVMESRVENVAALYSWHNFTRAAPRFGSGFVFLERFVHRSPTRKSRPPRLAIGRRGPIPLWNRATSGLALAMYEARQRARKPWVLSLRQGFFPILGLEAYYAAFGPRGFREYQVIVPRDRWSRFAEASELLIRREQVAVTLASLKLFRGAGRFLRFRGEGVCLAVDLPASPAALRLFAGLDDLAIQSGASLNLSKDSRIEQQLCERVFPEYLAFKRELRAFDPSCSCISRLRERIGV